jgi:hypothetical protein
VTRRAGIQVIILCTVKAHVKERGMRLLGNGTWNPVSIAFFFSSERDPGSFQCFSAGGRYVGGVGP